MKQKAIAVLSLIMGVTSAQATIYTDSTSDQTNSPAMNIVSVDVNNDAMNLNFTITLAEAGLESDIYARFGVAFDTTTNGSTTADAWNDKIIMSSGMDFWAGGWTVNGTNSAGVNIYDASLGGWPEWLNGGDGSTWVYYWGPQFTNNTISFSIPLATLGLSAGDSFDFDVYTFWEDSYPADALGLDTLVPWAQYDSGANVLTYTVEDVAGPMTYTDSITDQTNSPAMNIVSVDVNNDASDLNFTITLAEAGLESDIYARFGVGFDTTTNGSTTADAWNDKIIMSSGMDFWAGGWTVNGTNSAGVNIYDASLGGWPEWLNGGDGSTWVAYDEPVFTNNTISFSIPLATLGLSAGDSFDFDVYTFWEDSYPADALGLDTLVPWAQYDSSTNVLSYTVEAVEPVYGDPAKAFISLGVSNVVIEFLAESNVSYYVQSTSNLTQSWVNVSSLIIGDGTTNSTSYPADSDEKFFQVIQP